MHLETAMGQCARVAAADLRTTTGANNPLFRDLGLSPSTATSAKVREKLREPEPAKTEEQMARLGQMMELLERRGIRYYQGEEDNELNELITFLCIN